MLVESGVLDIILTYNNDDDAVLRDESFNRPDFL